QNGSLETGGIVVAGNAYGRIRAMFDYRGRKVRRAEPSTPVRVMGLNDVPAAGELFLVYDTEREARQKVEQRRLFEQQKAASVPKATLEQLFERYQAGEVRELCLVIKADVQGSLEPIMNSLNELSKGDISVNILHAETGNISESDVMLAATSKGIVIGFNVQADTAARRRAEVDGVSIRLYQIIYRVIEDIEKALKGMLAPQFKDVITGKAEIRAIFRITKVGAVAGCRVLQGEIRRNSRVRVLRAGEKVFEGELASLKHERDDVREIRQGFECGMAFKGFNDVLEGDIVECFTLERDEG
ncbi:MAG: translation initiation factor IF-2, partial [Anaerolineaceae bacterium]|nr:translation initiation factor IF-2 [Anaerolineaceae bacterium]